MYQPEGFVFIRYEHNPIITVKDLPYPANSVFNAGAITCDGDTLLLLRVEDRRGISHLTVARSTDGITDWTIEDRPTMAPEPERHPEELWGLEDPRITYLEELGKWAVVYTAYSKAGPLVALAYTANFRTFERQGPVMPPEDKDAALFPETFDGRWALIHRPTPADTRYKAGIWISFSPDLRHWGDHQVLLPARDGGWWDSKKVGIGPPPLKTSRGWLMLYHGVRGTAAGDIYRLGLALLDLQDPRKVVARSEEWVFGPAEKYEREGDVAYVVFPCGWTLRDGQVRLYYGASDMCICLATARLDDLLAAVL